MRPNRFHSLMRVTPAPHRHSSMVRAGPGIAMVALPTGPRPASPRITTVGEADARAGVSERDQLGFGTGEAEPGSAVGASVGASAWVAGIRSALRSGPR